MAVAEAVERFYVIEVFDADYYLVETLQAPTALVLEVPVTTQVQVVEVQPPPAPVVETLLEPKLEVVEVISGPEYAEVLIVGPQGPAGDDRFHVGPTPPADTSLIWVDTSGGQAA